MTALLEGRIRGLLAALLSLAALGHARAACACLAPGTWHLAQAGTLVERPAREVFAAMATREIVLLGERHDDASHHAWQLQLLGALHVLRPDMVLGFEAFPRRVQAALDRWVAGDLSEADFLKATDWDAVWRFPAELYLPLFRFARMHRLPMVALNVERSLTEAIAKSGLDAVPVAQREGVSRPAAASPAYRQALLEIHAQHAHGRPADPEATAPSDEDPGFRRFVEAQTTWDRAMAEALAARVRTPGGPLVVGLMGSGHLRHGHGVPHQLRALEITRVGTLLPFDLGADCAPPSPDLADAVFAIPQTPPEAPPPPRLGVSLAQDGERVRVMEVAAGSLAAASGLAKGDRVTTVAGRPARRMADLIAAVREQPPGTVLPLGIEREGKAFEILVRFPSVP